MTTVINTPPPVESSDSGLGLVLGVLLSVIIIALFFVYGLPAIQNNMNPQNPQTDNINVNVKLPPTTPTSTQ